MSGEKRRPKTPRPTLEYSNEEIEAIFMKLSSLRTMGISLPKTQYQRDFDEAMHALNKEFPGFYDFE